MKGLLYREFLLMKKNMLITAAVLVVLMTIEILVMLSLRIGNLAKISENPTEAAEVSYGLFNMLNTIVAFGIFIADHGVTQLDFQCKWQTFSYTLPVSPYQIAGLKIGKLLVGFFCGLVVSLASYSLLTAITDTEALRSYNEDGFQNLILYMILLFGLYYTFLENIRIPMILKFHKESTATAVTFSIFAVLYVAIMGVIAKIMKDFKAVNPDLEDYEAGDVFFGYIKEQGMNFLHHWGWTFPILIVAFFAAGYFAIVSILKRRPY